MGLSRWLSYASACCFCVPFRIFRHENNHSRYSNVHKALMQASAVGFVSIFVVGCNGVDVYKGTASQKGIPFYVKVPVLTHETKRVSKQIEIQATVECLDANDKVVKSITLPVS